MNENSVSGNAGSAPPLAARISLVFVGLMAVLPFLQFHHAHPLPAFYTEFVAFALGLMALTLLLSGHFWRNLALPWIALAPLGLFAVLLLQLNLKMPAYYETHILAMLYMLWAALLVVLGAILRKEFGLMRVCAALAWFFLVGGELSAAVGIIQHYGIHTFLDAFIAVKNHAAVYGNVGQTNHFANHIGLALASLVFLFGVKKLGRTTAVSLALPLLFVLALSGQRSPWLYLFALLALSLLLLWSGKASMEGRRLTTASCLLIAGFALMQWLVHTPLFATSMGTITATDRLFEQVGGTAIRFYLWREAWQMFLQAPLLGVGWGQYAWHHFQLSATTNNPEIAGVYSHAHNLVIDLLAESGIAGTLPVVAGITLWLQGLKRQPFDLALWWLLAAFALMGIHSMLEFPLWYGHYLGLAAFLFGVGETRFAQLRLPRLGNWAMLLILVSGWSTMAKTERDYRLIESVMPPPDGTHKNTRSNHFSALLPLHQKTLLSPYVDFALGNAMELNRNNLDLKLAVNQRLIQFNPSPPVIYKQAVLLALKGDHAAAIKLVEGIGPAFPEHLEKFSESLGILEAEHPGSMSTLIQWADGKREKKRG